MDMNLLTVDGMKKLIEWIDLKPAIDLLMAELMMRNEPVDADVLRTLLDDNDLNIGVAGLLLVEQGDSAALSAIDAVEAIIEVGTHQHPN